MVALDSGHLDELRELAGQADDPVAARASIVRLREFDPELAPGEDPSVGDPYYGGADGFDDVLDMVERSMPGLVAWVRERV